LPWYATDEATHGTYTIRINGIARAVASSDPDKRLLYVPRGLGLSAAKFGCGHSDASAMSEMASTSEVSANADRLSIRRRARSRRPQSTNAVGEHTRTNRRHGDLAARTIFALQT